jgi:hypothetical protein
MSFNGHSVTIMRRGLIPMMTHGSGGTKTIPLRAITAIQHRRCGFFSGYLQLSVAGELETRGGHGGKNAQMGKDENAIIFFFGGNKSFQIMADRLRQALHDAATGVAPAAAHAPAAAGAAAKTPIQQLAELGQLRDNGYITPADFEAKKNDLLGRI